MGNVELRRVIEQVTKVLTPSRLEVRVEDGDVLHVLVVSEQFAGMPISKRFERLSRLFEAGAAPVGDEFTLIFQAWTKAELAEIEVEGEEGSQQGGDQGNHRAAKPAEI